MSEHRNDNAPRRLDLPANSNDPAKAGQLDAEAADRLDRLRAALRALQPAAREDGAAGADLWEPRG